MFIVVALFAGVTVLAVCALVARAWIRDYNKPASYRLVADVSVNGRVVAKDLSLEELSALLDLGVTLDD